MVVRTAGPNPLGSAGFASAVAAVVTWQTALLYTRWATLATQAVSLVSFVDSVYSPVVIPAVHSNPCWSSVRGVPCSPRRTYHTQTAGFRRGVDSAHDWLVAEYELLAMVTC